jgi:hypothetical protein
MADKRRVHWPLEVRSVRSRATLRHCASARVSQRGWIPLGSGGKHDRSLWGAMLWRPLPSSLAALSLSCGRCHSRNLRQARTSLLVGGMQDARCPQQRPQHSAGLPAHTYPRICTHSTVTATELTDDTVHRSGSCATESRHLQPSMRVDTVKYVWDEGYRAAISYSHPPQPVTVHRFHSEWVTCG